jgi:hypothetical protein
MATKWIAGLLAGVVVSLGSAALAQSATDRVFAALGQTSVTGLVPDAPGGGGVHDTRSLSDLGGAADASAGLGSSPDCVGGGGSGDY